MGIFDKAKDALTEHSEPVENGIDQTGDLIEEKSGGRYADQVDTGQDLAPARVRKPVDGPPGPGPEQPA